MPSPTTSCLLRLSTHLHVLPASLMNRPSCKRRRSRRYVEGEINLVYAEEDLSEPQIDTTTTITSSALRQWHAELSHISRSPLKANATLTFIAAPFPTDLPRAKLVSAKALPRLYSDGHLLSRPLRYFRFTHCNLPHDTTFC